jgi:putative salt-induced outer membrane protein
MTMRDVTVGLLLGLTVSMVAVAQEEEAEGPWDGKATLGYLATSGNTENSNLNTAIEVGYTVNSWTHRATAKAINATENAVTTAEAYDVGWKSEWNINEHDYLFGRLSWRKDRFSGYDQQLSETIGYGRRLIDRGAHRLNAEIGAGARQSDLSDGTSEEETVARAGLDYRWQISDNAEFRQDFVVESGSQNTYLESVTALSAKVVGNVALVASYTIKNNSEVPAATENTDTYTALSLEYTF